MSGLETVHAIGVAAPPVRVAGRLKALMAQRGYRMLPPGSGVPPDGLSLIVTADTDVAWIRADPVEAMPEAIARLLSHALGARTTEVAVNPETALVAYEVCERGNPVERLVVSDGQVADALNSTLRGDVEAGTALQTLLPAAALRAPTGRSVTLALVPSGKATPSDEVIEVDPTAACPNCGGPMVVKQGRFNAFLGCARFPVCRGKRSQ